MLLTNTSHLCRKYFKRGHLQKSWSTSRSSSLLRHLCSGMDSHLSSCLPISSWAPFSWSLPHWLLLRLLQPLDHRVCFWDSWVGKQGGHHLYVQLPGEQVNGSNRTTTGIKPFLRHVFSLSQATFGILATNVLGVLLGWLYNGLLLALLHCGFSLAALIYLPATPYELVRGGQSGDLMPLLQNLRGDQGASLEQEATFIIRSLKALTTI